MQIVDSLIDSNFASSSAGGMRVDRTDVTISNSQILRNTVAANGASYGGGLLLGARIERDDQHDDDRARIARRTSAGPLRRRFRA